MSVNKIVALTSAAMIMTFTGAMSASAGPAAQFSATVNKIQVNLACSGTACTDNQIDEVVSTIKVPNRKELLIGVSAQVGITTQTTVKGKLGGGGAATSTGGVKVGVELCPRANFNAATKACSAGVIYGEPGTITLNARSQELSAILGGVITSCTVGDDGVIDVGSECTVTDEQIRLLLDTLSAHHYNFVFPNVPTGEYKVIARFDADVATSTDETEVTGDTANEADASLVVGPRVVSVQIVRATNNPDGVVFELPLE